VAAGKWGDYKCDLNEVMLFSFFEQLRSMNPDVVFWAGDSIPHNVPTLTNKTNEDIMKNITRQIKENLVDHGIRVIPVIGNHDTYPQD